MGYSGNKRNEVENIYNKINFDNIENVIEPYCGTCAMSYYIWLKKPNLKFVLNDNNMYLKEMFHILKDDEKIKEFENKINNEIIPKILNKEGYAKYLKENKDLYAWFIANKFYSIRPALYPINNKFAPINLNKHPIVEFYKKADITFYNMDGIELYKKYKDDSKNLILLDPPYLSLCNDFYLDHSTNIYEYLYNNNIDKEKSRIYLILEKMWIILLLFKDNVKHEYNKTYETSKKKTIHMIIEQNKI